MRRSRRPLPKNPAEVRAHPGYEAVVEAVLGYRTVEAMDLAERVDVAHWTEVFALAKHDAGPRRAAATRSENLARVIPAGTPGYVEAHDPREHRIRWYARFPGSAEDWLPKTRHMAEGAFGWDVRCSCGQESRTGGGVASWVRQKAEDHVRAGVNLGGWTDPVRDLAQHREVSW